MPEISVIVPVYNVEKYLKRCIESIADQTFTDFECILIDDFSKDGSAEICDEIAKKDSRFIVVHKSQNEGLPKARKSGIDLAKGEFITHIDSDDWIELNAFELFIEKQKKTNADIVIGVFSTIFNDLTEEYLFPEISKDTLVLEYFFYARCRNCYAKLIRKKLYDNIIVPPYSMGEDGIYNVQIFSKLNDISQTAIVDSVIYNYDKRNENSITNKANFYKEYTEDPRITSRLWVEEYLKSMKSVEKIFDAFRFWMIQEGILYNYILYNDKQYTQKNIRILYKKYYRPFSRKSRLSFHHRAILETFNISVVFGKSYLLIRGMLGKIKFYINGMKF
jgi:glycosyltransferase involved in cell wall biosynthesis